MSSFLSDLKIARESAILGNYQTAVAKYRTVISLVKGHLTYHVGGDPGVKQKWKVVNDQLAKELQIAHETLVIKQSFSNPAQNGGRDSRTRKLTSTEAMDVNIVTPDANIVVRPALAGK